MSERRPRSMRKLLLVPVCALLVALVSACGDKDGDDKSAIPEAGATYEGPLHVARRDAEHPNAGAAGDIVDCQTWGSGGASYQEVYSEGATADDPDQALQNGRSEGLFMSATFDGLGVAKTEEDRVLYVLEVDGTIKQAIIVRDGPAAEGTGGPGWYVESWARCDASEMPESFTGGLGQQIWTDLDGNPVPTTQIESWIGPEHCGWQSMTFLYLDDDDVGPFVRAPQPDLENYFGEPYQPHAQLPADAEATGFMRDGKRLWLSSDDDRAYVGTRDDVEVWPRTIQPLGCD